MGDPAIMAGSSSMGSPSGYAQPPFRLVEVLLQGMTRTLWIDAIRIHLSSVEEKNRQIPVVRKIYSQEQGVMIWLGEEDEDSDLGMEILRR
jgi:hypothetical protein